MLLSLGLGCLGPLQGINNLKIPPPSYLWSCTELICGDSQKTITQSFLGLVKIPLIDHSVCCYWTIPCEQQVSRPFLSYQPLGPRKYTLLLLLPIPRVTLLQSLISYGIIYISSFNQWLSDKLGNVKDNNFLKRQNRK